MENKKLYRSMDDRALFGICAGLADYMEIDPIVVRLIVVILTLFGGSGILVYIIAIFLIPENPRYAARKQGRVIYEENYSDGNQENKKTEAEFHSTEQDGQSDPQNAKKRNSTPLYFGLLLVALGAYLLIQIFMPWIDSRIFIAATLIGIGVLVMMKK